MNQYNSLAQSVANEAPEAVMGVIETQTRAQMEVLKKQGEEELIRSGKTAKAAAEEWEAAFAAISPKDIHVKVIYDPGPFPEPPSSQPGSGGSSGAAYGGLVTPHGVEQYLGYGGNVLAFPGRPRGSDTVPIWATPGERVLSVNQNRAYEAGRGGGTQTIIVKTFLDGREIAQALTRIAI